MLEHLPLDIFHLHGLLTDKDNTIIIHIELSTLGDPT